MPTVHLFAPPFSGHLNPILALARELAPAFDVCVFSTPRALASITRAGLAARALLDAEDEADLRDIVDPGQRIGSHPLRLRQQFQRTLRLQRRVLESVQALYAQGRPDLVIADFTLASVGLACEARGVRWWTSHPSPCAIEGFDGPPAYLGGLYPAADPVRHVAHAAGRLLVHGFKRSLAWLYRREIAELGLASLYRPDGCERIYSAERILALGVPQFEFCTRWPAATRFVGPALYTPAGDHPDPPFVDGARHVLVTLGTHLQWAKDDLAAHVQRIARRMRDVQFHFSDGHGAGSAVQLEPNLLRLPFVDYDRHLPRYDVVVHHGGAGVLYHCLRARRPSIVWPLDYDQFDHAARLDHAQAAVWVRDPARLEGALSALLNGRTILPGLAALARSVDQAIATRCLAAQVRQALNAGHGATVPA